MNELIKVENRDGIATCNARELHEYMEVSTRFNDWIKSRIEKYDFIAGVDYTSITGKKVTAQGNESSYIDYYITLDMAKELSMVENNEKGKEARKYFIAIEKKAKELIALPKTFAEALRLAADQQEKIEAQKNTILELTPKAEFYDTVADSKDAMQMRDVAAILNMPKWGRNKIFELLRARKVLDDRNVPYRKYQDALYFRVIETTTTDQYGCTHINLLTLVFQSGIDFIRKIINDYESKRL